MAIFKVKFHISPEWSEEAGLCFKETDKLSFE
jgi:hypothetical protein